ncbi:MAG: UDP-glucose/GDP-mannose dehydrogenase family protein [Cyanobacteria bacterium P01_E01_bin.45]
MQVCVIGTGYVGLVTGVCLAHVGHDVICVDNNEAKVKTMQAGKSPIFEPGLSELMQEAIESDRIQFTTDLEMGVKRSNILFIAVGTPPLPSGESDTRFVEAVARGIGSHLTADDFKVVVNKSTVPIGSGDWVRMLVLDGMTESQQALVGVGGSGAGTSSADAAPTPKFEVVSNPEFLREGSAIFDTLNPDRIVLGGNNPDAIALMKELYTPIIDRRYADDKSLPEVPVVVTDLSSAEMVKYASNAFLATKISFANEIANICDRVGADVVEVAKGIGLDSRIGAKFLQAGLGWGGSCFPKDVAALIHTGADYGYDTQLLKATVSVNQYQRQQVIEKLQQHLKILKGKTVGLLGMTFKPNTDDMRDAPSLTLAEKLNRLGAKVKAFDPILSGPDGEGDYAGVSIESTIEQAVEGCDALVLVTEWPEFRSLDFVKLAQLMPNPAIVDGRNILDHTVLKDAGFTYIGIGH